MSESIIVRTGEVTPFDIVGEQITLLASGAKTGSYEIFHQAGPEGSGPPPHSHPWDEAFYVIEGRGTITVDGVVHAVGPTDLVFAPSPLDHALQAAADSRLVVIYFRAPGRKSARPGIVATVGQPAGAED